MKKSLVTVVVCLVGSICAVRSAAAATSLSKCTKITKPGSYVVTKPITAPTGLATCLLITIDHVTIDLDGYTLTGQGDGIGIATDGDRINITVRNGAVRNFVNGVFLTGSQFQIDHINASNNVEFGIYVFRQGPATVSATLSNNVASDNGITGIIADSLGTLIVYNVANNNGYYGITAFSTANLVGNLAANNPAGNISTGPSSTHYNDNPAP